MNAPARSLLALTATAAALMTTALPGVALADPKGHPAHGDGRGTSPSGDPAGNNGTIKINGVPIDSGDRNVPHVGCQFALRFFGFDADQTADITFVGQAPPKAGTLLSQSGVSISDDAAGGAGGAKDVDATLYYTADQLGLSAVTPAKQGWHVKVSVDVTDAPGGAKQKVFWLSCPSTAPAGGGGSTSGTGTDTSGSGATSGGTTSGGTTSGGTTSDTDSTGAGSGTTTGGGTGTTGGTTTDTTASTTTSTTTSGSGSTTSTTPTTGTTATSGSTSGTALGGTTGGDAIAPTYGGGAITLDQPAATPLARTYGAATVTSNSVARPSRTTLPFTGFELTGAVTSALTALGAGVIALTAGRRRRHAEV